MSEVINVQNVPEQVPPGGTSSDQASSAAPGGVPTIVKTLEDLKALAPPLYDAILMSIAMEIKRQQEHANAELKRILREADERQKS